MKKLIFGLVLLNLTLFSQWFEQTVTPRPPALYSVYAQSSDFGFACGDSGRILRTTNAGLNWTTIVDGQFFPRPVYSIQAVSPETLFCICNLTPDGRIYKSTNMGSSWQLNYQRNGRIFYDVKFLNSQTGIVYGQPAALLWFIARTTNGGATWDTLANRPPADNNFDTGFPNALHLNLGGQLNIWFGTSAMKIIFSTNGGINWNFGSTPGSPNIYSVSFLNQQTGFAGGFQPYRTSTGGGTWGQFPLPNSGPYYSAYNSGGRLWISSGPNIYYSTNGGANFILQHTSSDNSHYRNINIVFAAGDNRSILTGWGVTGDGIISRYDEVTGIEQIGNTIPENFKLEQNYPNPFNPVTHFGFRIADFGFVSIKIYDVLGNVITTLVNSQLKPGIYNAEWNASAFSSGIYYYTLTSGNFSETKKMILVK